MKKILLLTTTLLFMFVLTGCTSERTIECYDSTYSVTITLNKEEFLSVTDVYLGTETVYTDEDVAETQASMEDYYEGDNLFDIIDAFIEEAEDQGATCEEK